MKILKIDAIKAEILSYLPDVVKAADGLYYRVLGAVVEQTTCNITLHEEPPIGVGRRLQILLGEQMVEEAVPVEEVAAGPVVETRGSGN